MYSRCKRCNKLIDVKGSNFRVEWLKNEWHFKCWQARYDEYIKLLKRSTFD